MSTNTNIDWTDAKCHVTDHFTVGDCLTLHAWNRLATEADGADFDKLTTLCEKMEEIREFLGCPISVHCMFRSHDYNAQVVKAIPNDVHQQCLACDFDVNGTHTITDAQALLEPVLEQYGVRMEQNTPSWIHLDTHPVGNAIYFKA